MDIPPNSQWLMLISLIATCFLFPSAAHWACLVIEKPAAITVQIFEVITACLNLISVILGLGKKKVKLEIIAIFVALTFVFGIIPWAIVLGSLDTDKARTGSALWIAIGVSFISMAAACLLLIAVYGPEQRKVIDQLMIDEIGPNGSRIYDNSRVRIAAAALFITLGAIGLFVRTLFSTQNRTIENCSVSVVLIVLGLCISRISHAILGKYAEIGLGCFACIFLALMCFVVELIGFIIPDWDFDEGTSYYFLLILLALIAVISTNLYFRWQLSTHY